MHNPSSQTAPNKYSYWHFREKVTLPWKSDFKRLALKIPIATKPVCALGDSSCPSNSDERSILRYLRPDVPHGMVSIKKTQSADCRAEVLSKRHAQRHLPPEFVRLCLFQCLRAVIHTHMALSMHIDTSPWPSSNFSHCSVIIIYPSLWASAKFESTHFRVGARKNYYIAHEAPPLCYGLFKQFES